MRLCMSMPDECNTLVDHCAVSTSLEPDLRALSVGEGDEMEILAGKVAVVTGAAKGFGFALAAALAEERMRLVLSDIDEPGLEQAVASLQSDGAEAFGVPTDVSDAGAVERLRDRAFQRFETVHVLCNNAGIGGGGSVCDPVDLGQWHSVFSVNFFGALHGVNAFLPRMLEQ